MYTVSPVTIRSPLNVIHLLWVNMTMDSFALICMPTILSLYMQSLKCDPAAVGDNDHGFVCSDTYVNHSLSLHDAVP